MSDNVLTQDTDLATLPTATRIATALSTWSGDQAQVGLAALARIDGPSGSRVASLISPSTANGAASIATGQVTVDTTAGGVEIVATRAGRRSVTIINLGTTDVFLGASGVSTADGQLLLGLKGASYTFETEAAIFGIVGGASQAVSFAEEYD